MKFSRLLKGFIVCSLIFVSVGCAANNNQDETLERRDGYRTTRVGDERGVRNYYRDNNVRSNPSYNMRNVTDNARYNTNNNVTAQNFRLADDVADAVADLGRVKSASVVVMGRNAYVGVVLKGNDKLTGRMKERVADRARDVDPAIRNVYVSANPEFVKQLNQYATELRAGRPVSGLINNMMDMVKRTFPEAK
ncbi:YhcN/YlaJ family sporulation lipoprotein [Lihuaxuella thermophila]|uniref:Sporulation lipoprotein, YhcN/YlaJ family n=1 Tax=Lihuaxuella thermophila TaxID=1173111 RepID=A0A1H8DFF3_9BACL|nr:YhcN/YlaJ family sporulation lipoprotein [Lihuaxuella thermophila]SEN05906.1 sporulation lipoprotein, YhcN/YlaJ family [Lihuaxuella thermophila]